MESTGDFSKIASKIWEADELRKKLMLKEKEYSDLDKRYKEMETSLKTEIERLRAELLTAQDAATASAAKYATCKQQLIEASRKIEALEKKMSQAEEEKDKKKGFGLFK
jgi:chromosome segregation ATPase